MPLPYNYSFLPYPRAVAGAHRGGRRFESNSRYQFNKKHGLEPAFFCYEHLVDES